MTVKQLIELLQTMPEDSIVRTRTPQGDVSGPSGHGTVECTYNEYAVGDRIQINVAAVYTVLEIF